MEEGAVEKTISTHEASRRYTVKLNR
jgi:hypothetical protein